jgi:hypothetical protein
LGDFLRDCGFQSAVDFYPIKQAAKCDEVMPTCDRPATHAKFCMEHSFYCERHAEEMRREAQTSDPISGP